MGGTAVELLRDGWALEPELTGIWRLMSITTVLRRCGKNTELLRLAADSATAADLVI